MKERKAKRRMSHTPYRTLFSHTYTLNAVSKKNWLFCMARYLPMESVLVWLCW